VGVVAALCVVIGVAAPASALLTGVDVASWQHPGGAPIDWGAVRASGQTFALVKATQGTTYTNPYFVADWNGAAAAGLYRGAYHYAVPALPLSTALDQARYFVSKTGSMTGGVDLPAVLDLEENGGLGPGDLAQWTRIWLGEVQRLTGKAPILYTGYYFWRDQVGNPTDIGAAYRLWLPSYPNDPNSTTFRPLVPAGWGTWTFWQYTNAGSVPGIPAAVDVNRFCCDGGSVAALAGNGSGGGGPFGVLDVASPGIGMLRVAGWAIDPDSTGPIDVHVYAGPLGTPLRADQSRPDVGAAYPGFGGGHGFSGVIKANPGLQQVCAYGINVGGGSNRLIGCTVVNVPAGDPFGVVDSVGVGRGYVDVAGWSIDPDTTAPNDVHVYVDGVGVATTASLSRPDVGAAFGFGSNHGFSVRVNASGGSHSVCAYGINVAGTGSNRLLGCRTVVVPDGSPFGSLDVVAPIYGVVHVAGWAIDPDTSAPIDVHVYVNGVGMPVRADGSRPDVGAAFPGSGASHGFDVFVPRNLTGPSTVCVYGINAAGGGTNSLLGCRTV
jgi:GH25 family lysozyme M1 (1,4-beta-N-acetylmuramidase)